MLIKNGMVYLADQNAFMRADIAVSDGKICAVTCKELDSTDPTDSTDSSKDVIDAAGKYITPGLIEAHCHIGISEESVGWEGEDAWEVEPITPEIRAIDGINPFDIAFREAVTGGVTTVCTGPGSAGVVAGTFAVLELNGSRVVDDMVIKSDAAMKIAFGENPRAFGKEGKMPNSRPGVAAMLRKCLDKACVYKQKKAKAEAEGEVFERDLGMENMLKVLDGTIPLKAHVHRADDICTAIRIAKEYNLQLTLDHCTDGHLIADYLAKNPYPALVGPSFGSKNKIELRNKGFETVSVLCHSGVQTAIITDHNVFPQESLVMFAAMAVKSGLSENDALKCITSNPADILGISDRKGRIQVGLDADIVIWDGHPLHLQAKPSVVYVRGKRVYPHPGETSGANAKPSAEITSKASSKTSSKTEVV